MALKRKPYYNESARYFNFMFETEEEATAFREVCELLGMTTDKRGYTTAPVSYTHLTLPTILLV